MAGASMKHIRTRIKSVESTMQITKAMELVAISKLRRAKARVENVRPFHEVLARAIVSMQATIAESPCVFSQEREVKKTCYVVIGGDRGLAGGYHANLLRAVSVLTKGTQFCVLPIGKKVLEHFTRTGDERLGGDYQQAAGVSIADCTEIAKRLCDGFAAGDFDRVLVVYTQFKSMLSQLPVSETLLPLQLQPEGQPQFAGAIIEGDAEELINSIVPQYVSGILYAALCEASASEHGARRIAMDSANKNAGELIDALVLKYNRARQAVITQELTEIVSAAQAL
ncbi:MAG: ATP synthase F1 subunit gamma [Oscillospiraceae bacterium]|jgi:F-type H+-transporting ATPase subunit gamma|nr:ATP synthase F1 subunit gamma [Oscillospiraceae bacterium]